MLIISLTLGLSMIGGRERSLGSRSWDGVLSGAFDEKSPR